MNVRAQSYCVISSGKDCLSFLLNSSVPSVGIILLLFSIAGCLSTGTKCCDFKGAYPVNDSFYLEKYQTFCAGVFGDLTTCYLTDSITFRQQIGSYDEHEYLRVSMKSDSLIVYNLQSGRIDDTVETKTLSKAELFSYHQDTAAILTAVPIFGKNSIGCDTDHYPASSYVTDDGYSIDEIQYKCGGTYLNACYYTDFKKFRLLIGIYEPGSLSNNYFVKRNGDNFSFYNVQESKIVDTVARTSFSLPALKRKGMTKVCE